MLIQSLIKPENKTFLQEDFDAVRGLRYAAPSNIIDSNDPWNNLPISISPQQIFDVLTQDLPGKPIVEIASDNDADFIISITEKNEMYLDGRAIDFNRKEIGAGTMRVELKGKGIGRKILRNYIEKLY